MKNLISCVLALPLLASCVSAEQQQYQTAPPPPMAHAQVQPYPQQVAPRPLNLRRHHPAYTGHNPMPLNAQHGQIYGHTPPPIYQHGNTYGHNQARGSAVHTHDELYTHPHSH